jgi:hypothetical protein
VRGEGKGKKKIKEKKKTKKSKGADPSPGHIPNSQKRFPLDVFVSKRAPPLLLALRFYTCPKIPAKPGIETSPSHNASLSSTQH